MPKRTTHQLKIEPRFYNDIVVGSKRFEVRRDDRDYQVDDMLVLREVEDNLLTGRLLYALVSYIHRNDGETDFLRDGYIIMGFDIIKILEI